MKSDNSEDQKKHQQDQVSPLLRSMNDFFNQKPVKRLLDSIDDFFEQPFPLTSIKTNMYETNKELIITADLPGVKREQIRLDYSSNRITISVKETEHIEEKNDKTHHYFSKYQNGYFTKTITLPFEVKEMDIKASYRNGQLNIRVPKQKRKRITISDE